MSNIFDGIRIIDFTNNLAGPGATAMFADFGAEVIKIERPVVGDDMRAVAPRIEGQSILHLWSNRGKKSVVLDLKDATAQKLVKDMIKEADVVAESFKPGQMAKYGLDYNSLKTINPELIYLSVSACGQTGEYAKKPGYDIIAQAMSGQMDLNGDPKFPPTRMGVPIGDYVGSFNAAFAVAAALFHRDRTGVGQYIDISLLDCMVIMNSTLEGAANLGTHPTRTGNHYPNMAPYGVFNGRDGQSCVISAFAEKSWKNFCKAMDKPELMSDPLLATNSDRAGNISYLVNIVEEWLKGFEDIDVAINHLESFGISVCKIKSTDDVIRDQNLWDRTVLVEVDNPPSFRKIKRITRRGRWIHMSETKAEIKRAPDLGEHNYEILSAYGLNQSEIDSIEEKWAKQSNT